MGGMETLWEPNGNPMESESKPYGNPMGIDGKRKVMGDKMHFFLKE